MARILVTEQLAETGLAAMRAGGHEVDVRLGLGPEQLLDAARGAAALVIRSATTVTAAVLEAGSDLVVVGRAGIGLDNVDVAAATRRGVMVVNAPQSNVLSAAEHTMALLLAQARNVPQAHGALTAGKWERSRWEGVELHGKILGVIGLGRVRALVAQRAHAFGMRLVRYDPYVTPHRGASTAEAQDKAGVTIAEQVLLALAGEFVPYAVNVSATEASETVRPFLPLAERLGRIFGSLVGGLPTKLDVEYEGALAEYDTSILTLAVLQGLFPTATAEPVPYVNA